MNLRIETLLQMGSGQPYFRQARNLIGLGGNNVAVDIHPEPIRIGIAIADCDLIKAGRDAENQAQPGILFVHEPLNRAFLPDCRDRCPKDWLVVVAGKKWVMRFRYFTRHIRHIGEISISERRSNCIAHRIGREIRIVSERVATKEIACGPDRRWRSTQAYDRQANIPGACGRPKSMASPSLTVFKCAAMTDAVPLSCREKPPS